MILPKIRILTDGSPSYGFGHISRSCELAAAFRKQNLAVEHINFSDPDRTVDDRSVDLTIVDLPYAADDRLDHARKSGSKIIALDYLGNGSPDILIRMNTPLTDIPCGRLLYGLDYAIIRDSIRTAQPVSGDYVIVSIGGADVGTRGYSVAQHTARLGIRTLLVRGPFAEKRDSGQDHFTTLDNPPNFSSLLAESAWVISNGGTTMVEAMSLGKAVYVVPQNSEEERFAKPLYEAGLILGIGMDDIQSPPAELISSVQRKARAAVDGKGSERIVEIGRELLN